MNIKIKEVKTEEKDGYLEGTIIGTAGHLNRPFEVGFQTSGGDDWEQWGAEKDILWETMATVEKISKEYKGGRS